MTAIEDVDSRHYRFGFVANSREELPSDFGVRETCRGFVSALFLPRHDAGWFGRSLYPPRMIILYDDALEIRAHPASGEEPAQIPLRELQFVELGHLLLHGWLRFAGERCDRTLLYNTRSSPSVRRFLEPLRSAFPAQGPARVCNQASFGQPLDLKFANARRYESIPGEEVRVQFFQPARRTLRRLGPLKRESWSSRTSSRSRTAGSCGSRIAIASGMRHTERSPRSLRFEPSQAGRSYQTQLGSL